MGLSTVGFSTTLAWRNYTRKSYTIKAFVSSKINGLGFMANHIPFAVTVECNINFVSQKSKIYLEILKCYEQSYLENANEERRN